MSALGKIASPFSKIVGRKRVSFLGPRIARFEYAEDSIFEDRPTLAVGNRTVSPVSVQEHQSGCTTVFDTGAMVVQVVHDDLPLSATNVTVTFSCNGSTVQWFPGAVDHQNLGGTLRTVDHCDGPIYKPDGPHGPDEIRVVPPGLLSRSGWSVVDQSGAIPLEERDGQPWVTKRRDGVHQDLYLFCYGLEFKALLHDAQKVFGAQPIPPRFAFGFWWSRYWAYTDKELERLIEECSLQGIPLDVLVIDMDWHRQGWTGFSWEKSYFPDPDEFLAWARQRHLHVSMNLHPADGIAPNEDAYADVARALGRDPNGKEVFSFDCTDPSFMKAYFSNVLRGYEKQGVEFWWMDWQQGQTCAIEGLDPLSWINHLHWEHLRTADVDRRPLSFSRWGGLGSGRYPIGFSGDSYVSWRSLAYLPNFTATSNNVLYGYWSHDIGGHLHGESHGELFTRWMQYGVYSPILRTHATKQTTNDRQFWEAGLPYSQIMKSTVRRRYELVPYIYTEAHKCFVSGVSLCRPMYIEHPAEPEAYEQPQQYYFGSEMIVSPITRPLSEYDDQQEQGTWLPSGEWFDHAIGDLVTGGTLVKRRYLLHEVPVFTRSGAILPGLLGAKELSSGAYNHLLLEVTPGAAGEYLLYEDDGRSHGYVRGECAFIRCTHSHSGGVTEVRFGLESGGFSSFVSERPTQIRLLSSLPAELVEVNGKQIPWSYRPTACGWSYQGESHTLVIDIPQVHLRTGCTVRVVHTSPEYARLVLGKKGLYARLLKAFEAARVLELGWEREIAAAAQTGNRVSRAPSSLVAELETLPSKIANLLAGEGTVRQQIEKMWSYKAKRFAALDKALAILRNLREG